LSQPREKLNHIGGNVNTIEIWQPRWKDKKVLIAKYKVQTNNKIIFTKTKTLEGKEYFITAEKISKYPIEDNGKIACYAVPLDDLDNE
jgi:hypothetical protein